MTTSNDSLIDYLTRGYLHPNMQYDEMRRFICKVVERLLEGYSVTSRTTVAPDVVDKEQCRQFIREEIKAAIAAMGDASTRKDEEPSKDGVNSSPAKPPLPGKSHGSICSEISYIGGAIGDSERKWTIRCMTKSEYDIATAAIGLTKPVSVSLERAANDFIHGAGKWRNSLDIVRDNPPPHKAEIIAGLKEAFDAAGVPYAD